MPASVSLHQLSYSTPDNQPLFSGLELSFGNERTGLIGRNGTGKSSLLRIIAGRLQPAAGSVAVQGSIGMLNQSVQVEPNDTVADHLGVANELARLDRLEQGLGSVEDAGEADWSLPGRVETALADVGLPAYAPDRPLSTLSGGQRTRLALARLILAQPTSSCLTSRPTISTPMAGRRLSTYCINGVARPSWSATTALCCAKWMPLSN